MALRWGIRAQDPGAPPARWRSRNLTPQHGRAHSSAPTLAREEGLELQLLGLGFGVDVNDARLRLPGWGWSGSPGSHAMTTPGRDRNPAAATVRPLTAPAPPGAHASRAATE